MKVEIVVVAAGAAAEAVMSSGFSALTPFAEKQEGHIAH